jgi:hypothetical protein
MDVEDAGKGRATHQVPTEVTLSHSGGSGARRVPDRERVIVVRELLKGQSPAGLMRRRLPVTWV